jgi:hypothetical protein
MSRPLVPPGALHSLSDREFVLIRPFGRRTTYWDAVQRAAAVELATGRTIISETPALDVYDDLYVAELANGDLGLYRIGNGLRGRIGIPYE